MCDATDLAAPSISPIIESVGFTAPKISFAGWNCAVGFTAASDVSTFSRIGFPASSFESRAFAADGASFAAATARPSSQNLLLGIVLEATNKALACSQAAMRKSLPAVAALEPALPPLRAPRRRRGRRKFRAGIIWLFCAACGIGVLILFKPGPPAAPKPALSPPPPPPPPPHPKKPQKPAKSDDDHPKKPPKSDDEPTQLRRQQCNTKIVKDVGGAAHFPLLATSAIAKRDRMFHAEHLLSTDGLQLHRLPTSSRLDDNGFGARRSCAVVGASGSVLDARRGREIDAHDAVARINVVRTAGFEEHVGRRTSWNFFWGHKVHLDSFEEATRKLPAARRQIGLVVPVKALDVTFFFEAAANRSGGGGAPLFLASDRVYNRALAHLCKATKSGAEWPTESPFMRPSSGLLAVVFALQACRNVTLYGLTNPKPCAPHHYFDAPPKPCTTAVPAKYDHPFHWFEREHELYAAWAAEGRLTLAS